MTIAVWIAVSILFIFGFLGCFINKFPGPLCAFIAVLLCKFMLKLPFAIWALIVVGVLVVASMVVAKNVVPQLMKKVTPFTKGATGTTVGSIIGLVVFWGMNNTDSVSAGSMIAGIIIGLILIPFVCAYIFEIVAQKDASKALKSSTGATVVYLANTLLKLIVLAVSLYLAFKFHAN